MGHSPSPPISRTDCEISTAEVATSDHVPGEARTEASRIEEGAANSAANSLWSSLISSTLGVFDSRAGAKAGTMQWTATVRRAIGSGPVRRLHDCILGWRGGNGISPGTTIWLLGVCYRMTRLEDESEFNESTSPQADFVLDFGSRIWITYRQGFAAIGQSKFTSDAGWGCMIRSGQMLLAQALVCHRLGRAWRRGEKPYAREYLELLQSFGDASDQTCRFSIHNFIRAGNPYGLAAGSWLGPYALCHAIEALVRENSESLEVDQAAAPMSVYVVSGDAEGERGGAPVLCIDDVAALSPVLILVPLVLGLDKVNPRYLPSLRATFGFPQSVGIAGGKPGASVYFVGAQEDQALYLDPHEVQKVVNVSADTPEVDTSSYHCSVVRGMSLDAIDPSLALGFYCRNRDEFDDLCERATDLANQSNGAPMFTVAKNAGGRIAATTTGQGSDCCEASSLDHLNLGSDAVNEEDWQIL